MGTVIELRKQLRYSVDKAADRPYRLFDGKTSTPIPHRCYSYAWRAHEAVAIAMLYLPVGRVIEVVDIRHRNRQLGAYKKRADGEMTWDLSPQYRALLPKLLKQRAALAKRNHLHKTRRVSVA